MPLRYVPPTMNTYVKIRNPADKPASTVDRYGQPVDDMDWGDPAWSNKTDQRPFTEIADGVRVRAGRSVFTIRYQPGIAPDASVYDVDEGVEYFLVGRPVERGGSNAGMLERFLELHCEARSGRDTA